MTEDLEIHIIELPKIKEMKEEGSLRKWILFLENPEGEETKKMAKKEPEIKEAIEALENIRSDEAKIRIAELREKYIADRESEIETAEEKRSKKIARKLKAIGISTEEIEEITELRREDIEALEEISADKEKVRIAELKEKYIADRESEIETAEEKGIKKGSIEKSKEIAKKLKKENMTIEKIAELTGLTKEEIEKLK